MTLPDLVTRYQESVESSLQTTLEGRQHPLYHLIKYQMGWMDEGGTSQVERSLRLHPTLTLSICDALDGDASKASPGAMAIEMLHQFTTTSKTGLQTMAHDLAVGGCGAQRKQ